MSTDFFRDQNREIKEILAHKQTLHSRELVTIQALLTVLHAATSFCIFKKIRGGFRTKIKKGDVIMYSYWSVRSSCEPCGLLGNFKVKKLFCNNHECLYTMLSYLVTLTNFVELREESEFHIGVTRLR